MEECWSTGGRYGVVKGEGRKRKERARGERGQGAAREQGRPVQLGQGASATRLVFQSNSYAIWTRPFLSRNIASSCGA